MFTFERAGQLKNRIIAWIHQKDCLYNLLKCYTSAVNIHFDVLVCIVAVAAHGRRHEGREVQETSVSLNEEQHVY